LVNWINAGAEPEAVFAIDQHLLEKRQTMDQGAELDALISRMIDDYVSRNRAAKVLRDSLDEAGVGFYPVADHLTLRTLNIDRRTEELPGSGWVQ